MAISNSKKDEINMFNRLNLNEVGVKMKETQKEKDKLQQHWKEINDTTGKQVSNGVARQTTGQFSKLTQNKDHSFDASYTTYGIKNGKWMAYDRTVRVTDKTGGGMADVVWNRINAAPSKEKGSYQAKATNVLNTVGAMTKKGEFKTVTRKNESGKTEETNLQVTMLHDTIERTANPDEVKRMNTKTAQKIFKGNFSGNVPMSEVGNINAIVNDMQKTTTQIATMNKDINALSMREKEIKKQNAQIDAKNKQAFKEKRNKEKLQGQAIASLGASIGGIGMGYNIGRSLRR